MRDRDLYSKILGLPEPWLVVDVELDLSGKSVMVRLGRQEGAPLACPECGRACTGYDSQPRRWRHLDTCQFQTVLEADVPRCSCPEHGVKQVKVPWAEPGSRFTALLERLAIDWMQEAGRWRPLPAWPELVGGGRHHAASGRSRPGATAGHAHAGLGGR